MLWGLAGEATCSTSLPPAGFKAQRERPETWKQDLAGLATLDWSRSSAVWQGRALVNGRVSKTAASVVLTANALKKLLGLELGVEDRRVEGLCEARG